MDRWEGKLAVVTGASSGIGAAIVRDLVKAGVDVVGVARRIDRVQSLRDELLSEKGKVYPVKADLTKEKEIKEAFSWIEGSLRRPVHILVNNAGVSVLVKTTDCQIEDWRKMFDTNVLAVGICIREHLQSMKKHNVDGGHIINICSIVGHRIIDFPGFYVYTATKHAEKVITEGVRQELIKEKSTTKITSISPGYVLTELFDTAAEFAQESADSLSKLDHLESKDVSSAVMYALSLPQQVRVHELIIQATGEFY